MDALDQRRHDRCFGDFLTDFSNYSLTQRGRFKVKFRKKCCEKWVAFIVNQWINPRSNVREIEASVESLDLTSRWMFGGFELGMR